MEKEKVTGRERKQDAAEKWLAENDPEYVEHKKEWETPSTDALARDRSTHKSLKDWTPLEPRVDGNYYRRKTTTDEGEHGFEYSGDEDIADA